MDTTITLIRLQQKLRREELKLARMKNRQDVERVRDTRLKYRLGGLIYLVGWNQLDMERLDARLHNVSIQLSKTDNAAHFKLAGKAEFERLEMSNDENDELSTSELSEKQKLALNHQVITIGGLMVKHHLDQVSRDALLGALIENIKNSELYAGS